MIRDGLPVVRLRGGAVLEERVLGASEQEAAVRRHPGGLEREVEADAARVVGGRQVVAGNG
jgi:hypothetical protein